MREPRAGCDVSLRKAERERLERVAGRPFTRPLGQADASHLEAKLRATMIVARSNIMRQAACDRDRVAAVDDRIQLAVARSLE
jgi:hypothetical protein